MGIIQWFGELVREVLGGLAWFLSVLVCFYVLAWGFSLAGLAGWPVYVVVIVASLWLPSQVFLGPIARFRRIVRTEVERVERRQGSGQ